jgi:hypothetical protein
MSSGAHAVTAPFRTHCDAVDDIRFSQTRPSL